MHNAGADFTARSGRFGTPLAKARQNGHRSTVELLERAANEPEYVLELQLASSADMLLELERRCLLMYEECTAVQAGESIPVRLRVDGEWTCESDLNALSNLFAAVQHAIQHPTVHSVILGGTAAQRSDSVEEFGICEGAVLTVRTKDQEQCVEDSMSGADGDKAKALAALQEEARVQRALLESLRAQPEADTTPVAALLELDLERVASHPSAADVAF